MKRLLNELSQGFQTVTLEDFKIRYRNIREQNPKVKRCSLRGCKNPRDTTPQLGEDSCCAYHRLLFDFWSVEVVPEKFFEYFKNQRARRRAFTIWRKCIGKDECDRVVLKLANEKINWEC